MHDVQYTGHVQNKKISATTITFFCAKTVQINKQTFLQTYLQEIGPLTTPQCSKQPSTMETYLTLTVLLAAILKRGKKWLTQLFIFFS